MAIAKKKAPVAPAPFFTPVERLLAVRSNRRI
jgi:hypothetical protein